MLLLMEIKLDCGAGGDQDDHGTFPLAWKVALGIRMFSLRYHGQSLYICEQFSSIVANVWNVTFLHAFVLYCH
jgi:hypothetical protein